MPVELLRGRARCRAREPHVLEAFIAECALARGANARLDAALDALPRELDPFGARRGVEELALALEASLLLRFAPAFVSDAFCAARRGGGGRVYGTLPAAVDGAAIVGRALEH